MMEVGIVDYGMGNIRSVANALEELGAEYRIVDRPDLVPGCGRLILPGVGAFGDAMANLRERGLETALQQAAGLLPILGICLGMQLMCNSSLEGGHHRGLGWVDAEVVPLARDGGLKIPHMGWNDLRIAKAESLFAGLGDGLDVYFVHSFRVACKDPADVSATCEYGEPFTAAFSRGAFHGTQFHPEKSQRAGLRMLANFLEL